MYVYMYMYIFMYRVFLTGVIGRGGGEFPPPPKKIKFPQVGPLPTNQQFLSCNPIKTAFLAVVIAPAQFLF